MKGNVGAEYILLWQAAQKLNFVVKELQATADDDTQFKNSMNDSSLHIIIYIST